MTQMGKITFAGPNLESRFYVYPEYSTVVATFPNSDEAISKLLEEGWEICGSFELSNTIYFKKQLPVKWKYGYIIYMISAAPGGNIVFHPFIAVDQEVLSQPSRPFSTVSQAAAILGKEGWEMCSSDDLETKVGMRDEINLEPKIWFKKSY